MKDLDSRKTRRQGSHPRERHFPEGQRLRGKPEGRTLSPRAPGAPAQRPPPPPVTPSSPRPRRGRPHSRAHARAPPPRVTEWPRTPRRTLTCWGGAGHRGTRSGAQGRGAELSGWAGLAGPAERRRWSGGGEHALLTHWRLF